MELVGLFTKKWLLLYLYLTVHHIERVSEHKHRNKTTSKDVTWEKLNISITKNYIYIYFNEWHNKL